MLLSTRSDIPRPARSTLLTVGSLIVVDTTSPASVLYPTFQIGKMRTETTGGVGRDRGTHAEHMTRPVRPQPSLRVISRQSASDCWLLHTYHPARQTHHRIAPSCHAELDSPRTQRTKHLKRVRRRHVAPYRPQGGSGQSAISQ